MQSRTEDSFQSQMLSDAMFDIFEIWKLKIIPFRMCVSVIYTMIERYPIFY